MEDDLLKGWKEISDALHVTDRTAQRWERSLHLPVHRFSSAKGSVVFARVLELAAWLESADGHTAVTERAVLKLGAEAAVTTHADGTAPAAPRSSPPTALPAATTAAREASHVLGQTAPAPAEADTQPALWRRLRLRWGLYGLAAITVLSVGFLFSRSPGDRRTSSFSAPDSRQSPAQATDAPGATAPPPTTVALRLTLANGKSVRMGVTIGMLASCTIVGQNSLALLAQPASSGILLRVSQVDVNVVHGEQRLIPLVALPLSRGQAIQVTTVAGLRAIEWPLPGERQPVPEHPATAPVR